MKIAVISDIHGNHYALGEVLEVAKRNGVERLLVLGDIVGYYYEPKRVLDLLSKWDFEFIKGNHEDVLADLISGKLREVDIRKKYGSGHRKALEQLDSKELVFLTAARDKIIVEIDGLRILMCHGAPWQGDVYLYPDTDKMVLDKCEQADADIVLIGHSHHSFVYKAGRSILVNVGSVGQSRRRGGLASWAIINTINGSIDLQSTPYDVSLLVADVSRIDPELIYLSEVLLRN